MSAAEAEEAGAANGGDDGGVDLGVLDAAAAANNNDNEDQRWTQHLLNDNNANNDAEDDDDNSSHSVEPSSLYDVYSSLHYASYTGSCCASDKADGTTLTPALPSILGLRVNGVGDLPLPLSDWHAKTLKSNRNTVKINNGSYHKAYTVDSARVRIKNPVWKASLEKLVQTVAYKLGVDPTKLTAELHSLLYMEKGSHVERCKNSDEGQNVLGTLFVQLPSVFTGGKISIFNAGETEDGDGEGEGEEEEETSFQLGAPGDAPFACHFVCHYKDCEYEFAKIKSGSRVLLRYSLRYNRMQQKAPTASSLNTSMSSLKWSLENLPPVDKMLLIPMAKEYTAASLAHNTGINAFAHNHRSHVEAIKAAAGEGWKLLIVTAELEHTQKVGGYYEYVYSNSKETTIVKLFNEEGDDVTEAEKWLKDVVNFDSAMDDGMLLADDENEYKDNWGVSTECSSSGYSRRTKKSQYRASFILAYDTSFSESELKCLRGIEGVAEVAEKVVATRDYNLLERMLKVVERKDKCKFDLQSVNKLLQMLTRAKSKNAINSDRIAFANRILSGLSSSLEPDDELFNVILIAVEKFGHDNITSGISAILNDQARLKNHKLSVFLRRVEFILTLNKRFNNEASYLEKSISDFSSSNSRIFGSITSDVLNQTIFSMIPEYGWDKMASVVEATLSFLHRAAQSYRSVGTLLDRALLIWKLHEYPCDFIQTCLVDFAKDFAIGLNNGHQDYLHLESRPAEFVKGICYTLARGTAADLKHLGTWASGSKETLLALLAAIPAQSSALGYNSEVLLRDILNKCLIPKSSSRIIGWYSHTREDGTIDPSLHIQLVLEKHPNLPRMVDNDGRITLHHAAATSTDPLANCRAPHETIELISKSYPEGVSIRDPVTRLYPFMLAAVSQVTGGAHSNSNNASSSFSLLLSNPSLVMSCIQEEVDTGDSRKRKRSASTG